MQFKNLLFAAAAALVSAQDAAAPPALADALSTTDDLSSLNTVLQGFPDREY